MRHLLAILCVVTLGVTSSHAFTMDASSSTRFTLDVKRTRISQFVDDFSLLSRHFPGLVSIQAVGADTYVFVTEKSVPLSGKMRTEFTVKRRTVGDTLTVYESPQPDMPNFMSCYVHIHPMGDAETDVMIDLRIRMTREKAGDFHWLAPVLGEKFLSEKMKDDIDDMLAHFVAGTKQEFTAISRQ